MAGVLFNINAWEFTKGVSTWTFAILREFWWLWLPLLILAILKILFDRWLSGRNKKP